MFRELKKNSCGIKKISYKHPPSLVIFVRIIFIENGSVIFEYTYKLQIYFNGNILYYVTNSNPINKFKIIFDLSVKYMFELGIL